ncbi:MAG: hypothetical protein WAO30_03530 [Thermacetogeniaceae bacterium]|nr:hypothetical protein [Thermoanaerobacterales bacterium]
MNGFVLKIDGLTPLELGQALKRAGAFPEDEHWYFCWSETDIVLPSLCVDFNEIFAQEWDVLRIFSKFAELRWEKRGKEHILLVLCEDEWRNMLGDEIKITHEESFTVEVGKRILAGKEMKSAGKTVRGKVSYPRQLDYGIDDDPKKVLVADINYYLDSQLMRRFVRYKRLSFSDQKTLIKETKPFENALEVMKGV